MIRPAVATLVLAAALLASAAPSQAADECKGLPSCIPVQGPWVVIPAPGGLETTASWKLTCPRGIVGGVDARASARTVAVEFPGRIGSPVNPGITTGDSLVFRGTSTGRDGRAASYQPFIGCIPTAGGGPRTRTSFQATSAVKPGQPITVRAATLHLVPGVLVRATFTCKKGERLLGSSHSVGLFTQTAPTRAQLSAVHVVRVRRGQKILVSATRRTLPTNIGADVQVQAVCAT